MSLLRNDFSGYTLGTVPGDWSYQWGTGLSAIVNAEFAVLDIVSTAATWNVYSWDACTSLSSRQKVDFYIPSLSTGDTIGLVSQLSGTEANPSGYLAVVEVTATQRLLKLYKFGSPSVQLGSSIDVSSIVALVDADFWVEFVAKNGLLKARIRRYSDYGPWPWDITYQDTFGILNTSSRTGFVVNSASLAGVVWPYICDFPIYNTDVDNSVSFEIINAADNSSIALNNPPAFQLNAFELGDVSTINLRRPSLCSVVAVENSDIGGVVVYNEQYLLVSLVELALGISADLIVTATIQLEQSITLQVEGNCEVDASAAFEQNFRFSCLGQLLAQEVVELGAEVVLLSMTRLESLEDLAVEEVLTLLVQGGIVANASFETESTVVFQVGVAA